MHTYKLTAPKNADGQPVRMFRAARENNEAKAIDQLSCICAGILADGVVNEQEAAFFLQYPRTLQPSVVSFAPARGTLGLNLSALLPFRTNRSIATVAEELGVYAQTAIATKIRTPFLRTSTVAQ